ncbi:MAG: DUF1080 domain-containing protein, partial [Planctomycetota bacterium]|nr:DUF1080 domain-containing protein [Planctomycetota bacterium]
RRFIVRRTTMEAAGREALVQALDDEGEIPRTLILDEMENALRELRNVPMPASWPGVFARLVSDGDADVRDRALALAASFGDTAAFPELRATLIDTAADRTARERALATLLAAKDPETPPILHVLLDEPGFRGPSLRALAGFDHAGTPRAILSLYDRFDAVARRDALNTLSARPAFALELLGAVERGDVPSDDLGAFVVRKLDNLGDPEVAKLLESAWGRVRAPSEDAAGRVDALKEMLDRAGAPDLAHGRDVFARTCQQCHTLFDVGGDLAPDLTGSNRANRDYLLRNLVDPSAEVGLDYLTTMVWLADESLATGLLWRETDDTLTLRTENDTIVVDKADVEERRLSDLSTMPDGLLDSLGEDEVRDLVAYLASERQVPRLATPDNAGAFFDGESLAGWTGALGLWSVEDGEIVGKTDGLARNEFLRSDMELRDFRLTFEVRLTGDQGNSGVQFRSRELEHGEVAGYQADIGPGWWGKLYEEHGRAVLWDQSGESHVVQGGWNTYEILAVGARVQTRINGHLCVDLHDPEGARSGIVALQIHSGGPTEIRFRAFRLELDPASLPPVPSDR